MAAVQEEERDIQKNYWVEHSVDLTIESMMLDTKASDLDKEERPEGSDKFNGMRKLETVARGNEFCEYDIICISLWLLPLFTGCVPKVLQ